MKALLILSITAVIVIIISSFLGLVVYLLWPLLITFILFFLGMFCKFIIKKIAKYIYLLKIKGKTNKIKEKLKIDEGVELVKESVNIY